MALINIQDYNIKIAYTHIENNPVLITLLPLSIISKAKELGFVYYDDFNKELKYKVAYRLFKDNNIVRINEEGVECLDHTKLPFTDRIDLQPLAEIDDDLLIDYFFRYNIEVKNILVTVFKNEYQISIKVPSIFMDTVFDDIETLETDIEQFIVVVYRRFISTANGSIPFMPWYGTNIKKYLHDLSVHQVEEMLQAEMDGLTYMLKNYFLINNILNYDFDATVKTEENSEYGTVEYKIIITINETRYTITIK